MALVLLPAAAQAGWPEGIPGPEGARLVRQAMAAAGVAPGAFADPVRGFPACDTDPVVGPRAGSWATAELRCPSPPWLRAIRTGAEPVADLQDRGGSAPMGPPVAVLRRPMARGAVLALEDLDLRPAPARLATGSFAELAPLVGRRLKAALGEGQPVLLRQLEPDWLVEAGHPVVILAEAGGLAVSAPGEALADGQRGDIVSVRNLSSGRELRAEVTARNILTVTPNMR